jgi:hypothetical protein
VNKQLLKDSQGWGFALWLIGYLLGIVLFTFLPTSVVGWVIMPVGIAITLWVLWKKIKGDSFRYYLIVAVVWTLIAVVLDYFLLVKLFNPADGYYKLDVYIYYAATFALPVIVGWNRRRVGKRS